MLCNNNSWVSHDTKYTILIVTTLNILHCSSGTQYTTVLEHDIKYNTVPCHTPNVTTLSSHLMPRCVHTHPYCFRDGRPCSIAELTGISSKCRLSWSIIHPAIEPLPVTLFFFLISNRDSVKPNVWTETQSKDERR